jgi:hypothetical protein
MCCSTFLVIINATCTTWTATGFGSLLATEQYEWEAIHAWACRSKVICTPLMALSSLLKKWSDTFWSGHVVNEVTCCWDGWVDIEGWLCKELQGGSFNFLESNSMDFEDMSFQRCEGMSKKAVLPWRWQDCSLVEHQELFAYWLSLIYQYHCEHLKSCALSFACIGSLEVWTASSQDACTPDYLPVTNLTIWMYRLFWCMMTVWRRSPVLFKLTAGIFLVVSCIYLLYCITMGNWRLCILQNRLLISHVFCC